jgi:hypothetical protein
MYKEETGARTGTWDLRYLSLLFCHGDDMIPKREPVAHTSPGIVHHSLLMMLVVVLNLFDNSIQPCNLHEVLIKI